MAADRKGVRSLYVGIIFIILVAVAAVLWMRHQEQKVPVGTTPAPHAVHAMSVIGLNDASEDPPKDAANLGYNHLDDGVPNGPMWIKETPRYVWKASESLTDMYLANQLDPEMDDAAKPTTIPFRVGTKMREVREALPESYDEGMLVTMPHRFTQVRTDRLMMPQVHAILQH